MTFDLLKCRLWGDRLFIGAYKFIQSVHALTFDLLKCRPRGNTLSLDGRPEMSEMELVTAVGYFLKCRHRHPGRPTPCSTRECPLNNPINKCAKQTFCESLKEIAEKFPESVYPWS